MGVMLNPPNVKKIEFLVEGEGVRGMMLQWKPVVFLK
jgi:hypothetical protein